MRKEVMNCELPFRGNVDDPCIELPMGADTPFLNFVATLTRKHQEQLTKPADLDDMTRKI